ncbi:hypothetical protein DYB32_003469 [Aphanomyces invadans]|uniref:PH domain-containing protein n=1 Tax=Aphanomyces invadans TaxID=157072 RepID=A0A3R6ZSG2_9STRA|nr:hypothetical protein DYB32_003469 [Aphanomyces invadans]
MVRSVPEPNEQHRSSPMQTDWELLCHGQHVEISKLKMHISQLENLLQPDDDDECGRMLDPDCLSLSDEESSAMEFEDIESVLSTDDSTISDALHQLTDDWLNDAGTRRATRRTILVVSGQLGDLRCRRKMAEQDENAYEKLSREVHQAQITGAIHQDWLENPCGFLLKPDFKRKMQKMGAGGKKLIQTSLRGLRWHLPGNTYRSRWFVLDGMMLRYFRSKNDDQELGSIHLTSVNAVLPSSIADAPDHALDLVCADRIYTIAATTREDMVRWATVLTLVVQYQPKMMQRRESAVIRGSSVIPPHSRMSYIRQPSQIANYTPSANSFHPVLAPFDEEMDDRERDMDEKLRVMSVSEKIVTVTFDSPGSLNLLLQSTLLCFDRGTDTCRVGTMDDAIVVKGFREPPEGGVGLAEATGAIKVGDLLVSIQDHPVTTNTTFDMAIHEIQTASRPLTLRFSRLEGPPTKHPQRVAQGWVLAKEPVVDKRKAPGDAKAFGLTLEGKHVMLTFFVKFPAELWHWLDLLKNAPLFDKAAKKASTSSVLSTIPVHPLMIIEQPPKVRLVCHDMMKLGDLTPTFQPRTVQLHSYGKLAFYRNDVRVGTVQCESIQDISLSKFQDWWYLELIVLLPSTGGHKYRREVVLRFDSEQKGIKWTRAIERVAKECLGPGEDIDVTIESVSEWTPPGLPLTNAVSDDMFVALHAEWGASRHLGDLHLDQKAAYTQGVIQNRIVHAWLSLLVWTSDYYVQDAPAPLPALSTGKFVHRPSFESNPPPSPVGQVAAAWDSVARARGWVRRNGQDVYACIVQGVLSCYESEEDLDAEWGDALDAIVLTDVRHVHADNETTVVVVLADNSSLRLTCRDKGDVKVWMLAICSCSHLVLTTNTSTGLLESQLPNEGWIWKLDPLFQVHRKRYICLKNHELVVSTDRADHHGRVTGRDKRGDFYQLTLQCDEAPDEDDEGDEAAVHTLSMSFFDEAEMKTWAHDIFHCCTNTTTNPHASTNLAPPTTVAVFPQELMKTSLFQEAEPSFAPFVPGNARGWLYYRMASTKQRLRRRYFVQYGSELSIYKHELLPNEPSAIRYGVVDCRALVDVRFVTTNCPENALALEFANTTLVLVAESDAATLAWRALLLDVKRTFNPTGNRMDHGGVLISRSSTFASQKENEALLRNQIELSVQFAANMQEWDGSKWVANYFVLTGSRLLVFSLAVHLYDEDPDLLATYPTKLITYVRSLLDEEGAAVGSDGLGSIAKTSFVLGFGANSSLILKCETAGTR